MLGLPIIFDLLRILQALELEVVDLLLETFVIFHRLLVLQLHLFELVLELFGLVVCHL